MKRERETPAPQQHPCVRSTEGLNISKSKIEIILFSFYLTTPPQIFFFFLNLLALFWDLSRSCSLLGFFFFFKRGWKRELGCPRIKPPCRAKPGSTWDSHKQTKQPQAYLYSDRGWAQEEQNYTEKDKNNSHAHQSAEGMLWGMLHLFLLLSELGNSWAMKALCKTPALAEMGTFHLSEVSTWTWRKLLRHETFWHCPAETVWPCSLCCFVEHWF